MVAFVIGVFIIIYYVSKELFGEINYKCDTYIKQNQQNKWDDKFIDTEYTLKIRESLVDDREVSEYHNKFNNIIKKYYSSPRVKSLIYKSLIPQEVPKFILDYYFFDILLADIGRIPDKTKAIVDKCRLNHYQAYNVNCGAIHSMLILEWIQDTLAPHGTGVLVKVGKEWKWKDRDIPEYDWKNRESIRKKINDPKTYKKCDDIVYMLRKDEYHLYTLDEYIDNILLVDLNNNPKKYKEVVWGYDEMFLYNISKH